MNSYVLQIAARVIMPVMLFFSLLLLLRGHNLPGGGFAGGLTAGAAFVLLAFANGVEPTLRKIRISPSNLIAIGLLVCFASGVPGLISGEGFFKGYWLHWDIPAIPKPGTPLLFDFGVYLLVVGVVIAIIFPNIKND